MNQIPKNKRPCHAEKATLAKRPVPVGSVGQPTGIASLGSRATDVEESGRRVHAGWSKPARLAKTSAARRIAGRCMC